MKWMIYSKNIEKQINFALLKMIIFVIFYYLFDNICKSALTEIAKLLSLFFAVYFLGYSLILTKRWAEKKYR